MAIFPTLFKLIMDLNSLLETGIKLRRIVSLLIPANFIISYIILHKTIRPRTPRHNGKVERSHCNDNNRFYQFLIFSSLQDLNVKGAKYLKHSNNISSSALGFLTPLQKRFLLILKHIFFFEICLTSLYNYIFTNFNSILFILKYFYKLPFWVT